MVTRLLKKIARTVLGLGSGKAKPPKPDSRPAAPKAPAAAGSAEAQGGN